jgi:hypothetical protein
MDQVAAINPNETDAVLEIHYQTGNKAFIDITEQFSSISEWVRNMKR